jgi:hypothetical protein
MVVLELDQVEIDHCLACGGIWLDSGELELLLEDATEATAMLEQFSASIGAAKGKRQCPICLKKMEVVTIGDAAPVQIDRCRRNHGLWFDRGELKEVVAAFDKGGHGKALKLIKDMFGQ